MELLCSRHARYLKRCLDVIPSEYASLDTARMSLVFYALSGLDLLGRLDLVDNRRDVIEWIYAQQVASSSVYDGKCGAGFSGSPTCRLHASDGGAAWTAASEPTRVECGHVTMTYTALASLVILGDDLARLDRQAVLAGVKALAQPDGSFQCSLVGGECDMRFVYCAVAVCHMLSDWSPIDCDRTAAYIRRSQGFDGGISQAPYLESHGGSTFCACAALWLLRRLDTTFTSHQWSRLTGWCISRQTDAGFNGRPNKQADTCYTFWIGAALKLLKCYQWADTQSLFEFVLNNQDCITGGLSKWPDHSPDPLHTYLGLAGLSVFGCEGLRPLHAALNISQRAADWLAQVQAHWRRQDHDAPASEPNHQPSATTTDCL